jgi:hypothetical protein
VRASGISKLERNAYLLHNTSLSLRERDMATRLILNELDFNLATLTTGLVIVVVLIVGAHAVALGAPFRPGLKVIMTRGELVIKYGRHIENKRVKKVEYGGGDTERGGDDPIE